VSSCTHTYADMYNLSKGSNKAELIDSLILINIKHCFFFIRSHAWFIMHDTSLIESKNPCISLFEWQTHNQQSVPVDSGVRWESGIYLFALSNICSWIEYHSHKNVMLMRLNVTCCLWMRHTFRRKKRFIVGFSIHF